MGRAELQFFKFERKRFFNPALHCNGRRSAAGTAFCKLCDK